MDAEAGAIAAEVAAVEAEVHLRRKSKHRSKPKRSFSEERLYHGFVSDFLGQESLEAVQPPPTARTAGPLAGMQGAGAWGTMKRPLRTLQPGAPASLVAVGVAAADGRKREARGGESEDGFAALCDITHDEREAAAAAAACEPPTDGALRSSRAVAVGGRVFHLLGIYDGHRSNHAARYCAEHLGDEVARRLAAALKPMGDEAGETPDGEALAEEDAVRDALAAAVVAVDAAFCRKRWASFVRDNGKKFYITSSEEVASEAALNAFDPRPLEHAWRNGLAQVSEAAATKAGLEGLDAEVFVRRQQERWYCYTKPLYPGCAACAVLVDAMRGKLFCANVGDCGALLFLPGAPGGRPVGPVGQFTRGFPQDGTTGGSPAGSCLDRSGGRPSLLMSRPHKPADYGELARVCGTPEGFVEVHGERVTLENSSEMAQRVAAAQALGRKALYRINRDVSLSRAVGDFDLREFGVVATPDVTVYALPPAAPGHAAAAVVLLVLASDGVWDVMGPDDVTALLEQSPEAAAAARNAHAAAAAPWEPGALDPPTVAPGPFLPSLARDGGAEAAKRIAAANEAATEVAHFLVTAAKGVTKNNDDVTVLVAALVVGTSPDPSPAPAARLAPLSETESQAEGLPALPGAISGAVPEEEEAARMATSPPAAHAVATEE